MKRSEMREAAFLLVFEKSLRMNDSFDEILDSAREADEYDFDSAAEELFRSVYEHLDELDGIIAGFSEKRQVSRISRVSLAVLRIAVYEINFSERVPTNAAISEAVNIAKKYALDPEVQFVNGVLGAYSRQLASAEEGKPGNAEKKE